MLQAAVNALLVKRSDEAGRVTYLNNPDIAPMGPRRRIWGIWSYAFFWSLSNLTIASWSGASSILSTGLPVGEVMGIIVVANVIIAGLALLNAAPGGYYHIGYTISSRVVFGIRGSYLAVLMRIILSVVWFGSQSYLGSLSLSCMISSWSKNYLYLENTFPESVNITRKDMIGFLLFQVICWPFLCVRPEKFQMFIIPGALSAFFAMMGITIWSAKINGGDGPLMTESSPLSSSARGWAWIYGISSWISSLVSGITNQSDFTRFSSRTWSSFFGTWIAVVCMGTVTPLMGLVSASALKGYYGGEVLWRPDTIINKWLMEDYSAKSRAAAFFCGLAFAFSQLMFNVQGNGYAGGMDLSGIFPMFINIRRGSIITALLSWVVQPWLFYTTSSTFLTVMSSFSVFMVPIIGIIVSDFWMIRRKNIQLSHLYTDNPNGAYFYWHGFNIRSLCVLFICMAPGLPGLINAANPSITINTGIKHFYQGAAIFELSMAIGLNIALSYIFPYKGAREHDPADFFGAFTEDECLHRDMIPYGSLTEYEQEHKTLDNVDKVERHSDDLSDDLREKPSDLQAHL